MFSSQFNVPEGLFGQFDRLRRELDDVFGAPYAPSSIRFSAPGAFPAINIGNTPQSVEIFAFAPGIDAQKIEVVLDRGVLTLSGERPSALPEGDNKAHAYSRERATGRFKRAVSLPEDADPTKVEASYRDGILKISVARREAAQPKRISVQ